jgi:phage shock protein A
MATKKMIEQLTSAGEGALGKLVQNPVTHKALEGALQVKDRVEKLVGSLGELETRVAKLEKRMDALDKPKRSTSGTGSSTAKKTSTAKSSTSKSGS